MNTSVLPTAPGRYLLSVGGELKTIKVIDQNGELYAMQPSWFIFSTAVPIKNIEGRWIAR